jgi:hypothetical protein
LAARRQDSGSAELRGVQMLQQHLLELFDSPAPPPEAGTQLPIPALNEAAGRSATRSGPSPQPALREVLASMATLGAALERVGAREEQSSPSWQALGVLEQVVEQWVLQGSSHAKLPPSPSAASEYFRRAAAHLGRLGESRQDGFAEADRFPREGDISD